MAAKKAAHVMTAEEISTFCDEIAMMLGSGMQLYDGVEALAQTYAETPRAALYQHISERMVATGSLYESLKESGEWPAYLVEMAGVGERTGRLEDVMKGLSSYYSREGRIRDAVVSAVTYPLVLAVMVMVIVVVMIVTVLPVFQRMLGSMGVTMTSSGAALMNIGLTIGWVVLAVIGVAIAVVLTVVLLLRFGNRNAVMRRLRAVLPPLRHVMEKLAASRITSVLSMMISSGFPMDEALRMVPPVLEDQVAEERVTGISQALDNGVSFGEALEQSRILDEIHTRMVRMAVSIGSEDAVMAKLAASYEEQVESDISALVSVIEPSLVAMLCLVIGAILLSVMLPMGGIISSIL